MVNLPCAGHNNGIITILLLVLAAGVIYYALSSPDPAAHADFDYLHIATEDQNPNNLDPDSIAKRIHLRVNEHRQNNGIPTLGYEPQLASIALSHSKDMAEYSFFSHYNNARNGPVERAEQAGYYCHKALGNGYYTEGISENIALNFVHEPLVTYYNGVPDYDWLTEDELAESIFIKWKTSADHNQNMLEMNYGSEGLGIVIAGDGTVYATQDFC